jgi:hypothetical protein
MLAVDSMRSKKKSSSQVVLGNLVTHHGDVKINVVCWQAEIDKASIHTSTQKTYGIFYSETTI